MIDHKSRKSYSDERKNNWKSLLWALHFCNLRRFVVTNAKIASHCHYLDKPSQQPFQDIARLLQD